jgi:hypothetical protein
MTGDRSQRSKCGSSLGLPILFSASGWNQKCRPLGARDPLGRLETSKRTEVLLQVLLTCIIPDRNRRTALPQISDGGRELMDHFILIPRCGLQVEGGHPGHLRLPAADSDKVGTVLYRLQNRSSRSWVRLGQVTFDQ